MDEKFEKYVHGPDQLVKNDLATELTTTEPDGVVRIRKYTGDCSEEYPILSVPTMLRNTAEKFPEKTALSVKRSGKWVEWSYKEYYEQSKTTAMAFIKLGLERFHSVVDTIK